MDCKKSIEALQFFATGLTEGALVHKLQGQIFKSKGFEKLGQKYIDHFNEEMEWVEKFNDRILDLGGEVKVDGEICTQRGKKLRPGNTAELEGRRLRVEA